MNRRILIRTVVALGLIALVGLFAAPVSPLSWHSPAAVEANDPPAFDSASITRTVDENTPPFQDIGSPVTATDPNDDRLTYSLENARTSPFTIVRATGQLQVGQPLDHETEASYTVEVIVTDPDDATDTIEVTVTVENVDEDGKVSLTWTKPQVNTAITASLTDPDGVTHGPRWQWATSTSRNGTYTNLSGDGADTDTYTPQPGDVGKYLQATASYTDGESSGKGAQAKSATPVRAVPAANQAPVFTVDTGGGYGCGRAGFEGVSAGVCLWVPRSTPAGDDIYYPRHVTDSDGDEVRYSLGGDDGNLFRIDPVRGTLFTTAAHAYDNPTNGKFNITITAADPSNGSDDLTAVLKPSGGEGPPVVNGPSRITYTENGTWKLATYTATAANPPDHEDVSRPIRGWIIGVQPRSAGENKDGDFFDIDDDGVLTFVQPPDYEDPADEDGDNVYDFHLHVYDTNPPNRRRPAQTSFHVRVTVVDVEVEALEIRGPSAVEYPENGSDPVATYRLDRGSGTVNWYLSGPDGGQFSLSEEGVLRFNGPPDYENPTDGGEGEKPDNAYLVTITADSGGTSKTEFVRVRVTNVNESPEFDEDLETTLSVDPNTGPSQQVGDPFTATDPDDEYALLTYSLSTDTLPFRIDPYNGQLSTSPTLAQFDNSSYTVTVLVTDGQNAAGNPDTSEDDRITVTINVEGDGNSAPEFPSTETDARSFPENSTGGQNVGGPVTATDGDNDRLIYTLGGTDAADFQILGTTGQIQTKAGVTYDYEDKSIYLVRVTAADTENASATKDVTITVINLDEPGTVTLSPNPASARTQITAALADPDGGVTDETWQWAKSDTAQGAYSNINGATSDTYTPADEDVGDYLRATVSYTDGEGSGKSAQATTTQAVRAGENRRPEFSAESDTRSFAENTAAGENIGPPVTATDPDTSDSLTYTLEGTNKDSFQIVSNNGQIQTKAGETYDHETTPRYSVTVKADDSNGGTDTIDVSITVNNIDEPPVFTEGPTTVEFPENDERGVASYSADDPEDRDVLLTLDGADETLFSFTDGNLAFKDPPDFEAKGSNDGDNDYQLTVQAPSGTDTVTLNVTVTVTDVNEAPAFPDSETGTRSVVENTAPGENIGAPVSASDPDTDAAFGTLTYTLSGTDAGHFDIVTTSGQLQTKEALDLEGTPSYSVTVSVTDGVNASGGVDTTADDTIGVTITVTNQNEAPQIASGSAAVDYPENGTGTVETYTATDPDDDDITWSVTGADSGDFDISSAGELTFKSSPNFESPDDDDTNNVYLVTVIASDTGKTDTRAVTVTVNNVNEAPAFAGPTATRSVVENTASGENIGAPVSASDPDAGATLTYSLGTSTDDDAFSIDTSTGQLKTEAALDKETKASYTVTVSVTDGKDDSGNAENPAVVDDTITVTITVTDQSEGPEITGGPDAIDYAENSTGAVGTYTATDPDTTLLTWTLEGTDAGQFSITDGVLTFRDPPDFEDKEDGDDDNDYEVTVKVSDGAEAATREVTVTVTNVNEKPTFPAETATREVQENTTADQNIGAPVSASDPDTDAAFGTLTYTLSGTDATSFNFDTSTGQIKTKGALDKETKATYNVTVSVTDGKDDSGTADQATDDTITVTITVTDQSEGPEITGGPDAVSYAENGTGAVGTYTATDPDTATASLDWTLSGNDAGQFNISAGVLAFNTPPSFEARKDADANNVYLVTVKVSDGANHDTRAVAVTVTDVNEPPAFPSTEKGRRSVEEGTSAAQDIGSPVAAIDPEGDTITYSVTGADATAFTLDTSTGQLQTKNALDADTKPSYSFTIGVSDSKNVDGNSDEVIDDTIPVEITVTGVNEAPDISGDATPEHAENDTSAVATYAHNDPEGGITWTPAGDDRGDFLISSTGELTFKNTPDFETPMDKDRNNIYRVTLTADDGTNTDTFEVTVTVTNVNEPPFFPAATATRSVPENTPAGQNIGLPMMARDWDTDANFGTLTHTLSGTDDSSFDFDTATGRLKTKVALDHEAKAIYTVTVSVTDGKNADGNTDDAADDTVTVTIKVTGANDQPAITGRDTLTYDENGTGDVATYTATDQDVGDTITWRLSGTDDSTLSLSSSGVLTFDSPPDFEAPQDRGIDSQDTGRDNEYLVTVEAFDGAATTTLDVTITVSNVDETGELTFLALQPQAGTELTAMIVDPDGSVSPTPWKWELSDDGSTGWTVISGATSEAYTPVPTDVGKYLRVTATYTDALTTSKTLTAKNANAVQAAPVTNTAPEFAGETATRSVSENSPAGTNVGAPVTATDLQSDTLTYSLGDIAGSADADSFTINQSSGQLRTKVTLDRETKSTYTVTVTATDPSGLFDTITVTIAVTDENEGPLVARTDRISHPENSTVDIVEYTARDPEGVTIIWSVTGTDSARFTFDVSVVDGDSIAALKFRTPPDFEAPTDNGGNNVYLVTVVASDGTNSNATDVIVTVTDVNERPAFPSTEKGQRTVAEDTGTGQNIGSPVSAGDPDAGDSLKYTLGGVDYGSFYIVEATGQLQTRDPLEYDTQSRYTVSVTATDTSGETATIAVAIVVTEVAEAPAPPPPPPPPPPRRPVQPPVQPTLTEKPSIDSVTPGSRSLTVAWSAPTQTGGAAITTYDLRHIERATTNRQDSDWIVSEDAWTGSGPLVHALVGLKNGVEYDVQVRAGYAVGSGPWSDTESGTPTSGTDATDECTVTLGSPTTTVTHVGTWTSDCESTNRIGSYARFYTFTLKEETEVQIDLTSSQDTYLFLLNGTGKTGTVADSNDDAVVNEDTNSQISGTLATGAYTIEATTYTPRITGDFTLTLTVPEGESSGRPGGTQTPQPPQPQPPGGTQTPTPPAEVGPTDAPTITTVTPGARILTVVWTAPTDTGGSAITAYDLRYIRSSVTDRADSDWIVLEDVWTGSGALEHQLTGLDDNVEYDLQVRASYAVGSGSWSLIATGTPGTSASQTPTTDSCLTSLKNLTGRVERTGTWDSSCESVNRVGRYARFYSFTLGQRTEVQIDVTSTEDPYLFLLEGAGTDGKSLAENDDVVVDENTNSRIVTTLSAGAYTIEATTYLTAQTGDFTLTISLPGVSGGSGGSQSPPPGSSGPGNPTTDGCVVNLGALTGAINRTGTWAFDCDSTNREGSYARFYTFVLAAETNMQVGLTSTDEDSYLFLLEGSGTDGTVLAKNDDVVAGTDLNSQLSATLAAGNYTIEATTYGEEVSGEFDLTISITQAVEEVPDPCVTALETPTGVVTQEGSWSDDCQATNRIGTYARFYTFTLGQDTDIQIDLTSTHDPYLFLLLGAGRNGNLVAQNDDITPAVDLDSRISMTLEAGTYTIEATTYNTWDTGDFTLTIVGPEGASTLSTDNCVEDIGTPGSAITKSGSWTGVCDSTNRQGRFARFYTFNLDQETEVRIDLTSGQDPFLLLLEGSGTSGPVVASNDDIVPNVNLDSRITDTLAAGSYTIEATTYDVGETGQFTLTLTP